jgi:hypothetical protein
MVKMANLGDFEGSRVTTSTVKVTNAGDGLSQAMRIEPVAFKRHERLVLVLDCIVDKVTFADGDMSGESTRVHVLKAGTAIVVERDLVAAMLDEQAERIKQAKEDAAGLLHLDGTVKKLPKTPTKAPAKKTSKRALKTVT